LNDKTHQIKLCFGFYKNSTTWSYICS